MLTRLSVRNFAVISQVDLFPQPGLNVFTGETGAGKSVAISALSFALGARGSASLIKDGADKLEVRAEFTAANIPADLLQKYAPEGTKLELLRTLDRSGKSKAFINGRAVPATALAELGRALVDFHGQHEHQSLLQPEVQLNLLDSYAGLNALRAKVHQAWKQWREACGQLDAAQMSEQEKQQKLDLYSFQLKEIEAANPRPNEDMELEQKLPQLKHAGKLAELAAEAYNDLYDAENSVTTLLGRAIRQVHDMAALDENAAPMADMLTNAESSISDVCARLSDYQSGLAVDPQILDDLLSRHEKLKRLKMKYGPELADVLSKMQELKIQIDRLQNSQLMQEELEKEVQKKHQVLDSLCEDLHEKRLKSAEKLAKQLEKEITPLGFAGLQFEVAVEMDGENPGPTGADTVEFLFSPNPGQAPRPLRAVASGGELSRVMLGLKTVLAGDVSTMVFDEVDTGVGGRTAVLVGRKLHQVASGRQVLCVTHLASVAVCADAHFHIEKKTDGKTTEVTLTALDAQDTEIEIARMLGALSDTDKTAREHARQLLAQAKEN